MKKIISPLVFIILIAGVLHISGCAKKTSSPAEESTSDINSSLMEVSEKLKAASEAGAENTWEYQEAQELFTLAEQLVSEGKLEEAEEALSMADLKATQALGSVTGEAYMEGFDEEAQEMRKSLLSDAFSRENLVDLPTMDVFFEYESAEISPEAAEIIDRNINLFEENRDRISFVLVFGFCDIRGTEEYNLSLAKRRADAIKNYMIGKGVSPDTVHSISKGETEMWQEGTSEEAYSRNRRGHFMALSENTPSENQ